MSERWRKPITAAAIEVDADAEFEWVDGEGHKFSHYDVTMTRENVERIRLGYCCIQCWEPHQKPFPPECKLCGFPIKARQAQRFEREFKGEKWIGPRTSLDEEIERMHHERAKQLWTPGSSVHISKPPPRE